MKVDVLVVRRTDWWATGWGFKFIGTDEQRVLTIYEDPYNVYARGREEEVYVDGYGVVRLYENQKAEIWPLEKLLAFLQDLNSEYEVKISESVYSVVQDVVGFGDSRWWTTGYDIYM